MMDWVDVSCLFCSYSWTFDTDRSFVDGFFDAGMLLQAIKASQEEKEKEKDRPGEKAMQQRRAVGKKLRLNDY